MNDNYHQQILPSLTFARPWAKLNLGTDQKFRIFENIVATPQKYICIQTRILLWIRTNWSIFQTYPYYLQLWGLKPSLGSWVIERQNDQVKHYVSCSLFNHGSRLFISFQNKNSEIPLYDTLKSLNICGICGSSPKVVKMLCLLLFLLLRLMWSS